MAVSQARKIAVRKYREKTYDTIGFDVKKGKRDEYKAAAAELGISLAGFLTAAAEEFIERHGGEVVARPLPSKEERLSSADKRLVEEFNQLPDDIKPTVRKLIQQINSCQNAPE